MRVCFDSNVVIDILAKSEELLDSYSAYDVALSRGFEPCLPMFSTTDIAYVLRRYLDAGRARSALESVLAMFELLDGLPHDCREAYASGMPDYEDAVIAYAAKRNNVDLIVTRNKRDFALSPVPVMTPAEFLAAYRPPEVNCALADAAGQRPDAG